MAVVSSHTLNSVDGSHAGGIKVRLTNLATGELVFDSAMDDGGRLVQEVDAPDPDAKYEITFETGPYWQERAQGTHGSRIMDEIVVRFRMPEPQGRYHVPLILSPHGYAMWSSTEHG